MPPSLALGIHTEAGNASSNNELREAVRRCLDDLAYRPDRDTEEKCTSTAERIADQDAQNGRDYTPKVPSSYSKTYFC